MTSSERGTRNGERGTGRRKTRARIAAAVLAALVLLRVWPHASLEARVPLSTGVWSADGEVLRVTLASDDQYRLWVPLEEIAPVYLETVLLKEDRWFYWHPGVNPVALTRAATRTFGGDRQGGSTLTMQLARLLYRMNTKTLTGKAKQIAAALWLERRYSKHDLLEAYVNLAPFGGNIEGVGAASRIYFGKAPDRLTLGEALTLAVVPQSPTSRGGASSSEARLLAARTRLGADWLARSGARPEDADNDRRQLELPILARPQFAMPRLAPHFVDAMLADPARHRGRLVTTLDASLQRALELQIRRYLAERNEVGMQNAAAIVIDTRDMAVKAWVGSADYWNARDGQVNGVLAKRSPGSALKPFIYALALDEGVLHPRTMLRDAPSAFGPFTPENFDGQFAGPVSAQDALVRSRNIPAVWVSSQLTQPTLYDFLRTAGIRDMKPESFYGLALALGGGEVTMEELAGLYAMLANQGLLRPLRSEASAQLDPGVRLLSPQASFITLDMLRNNPRPGSDGLATPRMQWPVAWKTGTSWGFRDAWTAGIAGPYAVVTWIGNFNGQGNPAFVGADAAAPLFFRIIDALNLMRPSEPAVSMAPPEGVSRVAVCVGSGDLPNADCPHTMDTWFIPGKSPIRVSQLHRRVALDRTTGIAVCPPYVTDVRFEVYEYWSSDLLSLFREAGVPRRLPPALPACAMDDGREAPRIASPLRNVTYALQKSRSQDIISLDAIVSADVKRVYWFDGNALIGARTIAEGALPWRPDRAGLHLIRVVDDHGRAAERDVTVTGR